MAFIKIQQQGRPGFYTFVNPAFVTHVTSTVGEEGGVLTFHLANQETPVEYVFEATNSANAEKKVVELIKNLLGASKDVDSAPRTGLVRRASNSDLIR